MSDEPISLSLMTVADLPELLPIERAAFPTPWTEANFRHEIEDNPLAWNLVARIGGRIGGFACAYVVADEIMINDLAVGESARRRGVASALLRRLLDDARSHGCRRATLEVRPSNAPARALYEKFGFVAHGVRRGYYADTGEDALLLSFDLGERRG